MSKSRTIRWVILIAALAVEAISAGSGSAPIMACRLKTRKTCRTRRTAVPVTIAPVEKADFALLPGLGTVQGFNTVVVRTWSMARSKRSPSRRTIGQPG
jgi:multidrug efflux system membrane fusion protein